jgi:hypothetical protein
MQIFMSIGAVLLYCFATTFGTALTVYSVTHTLYTGDGKEQEENEDECDVVGSLGGDSGKGGDIEKGNSSGGGKLSKQSIAAENLKVFTQVRYSAHLNSYALQL